MKCKYADLVSTLESCNANRQKGESVIKIVTVYTPPLLFIVYLLFIVCVHHKERIDNYYKERIEKQQ